MKATEIDGGLMPIATKHLTSISTMFYDFKSCYDIHDVAVKTIHKKDNLDLSKKSDFILVKMSIRKSVKWN
jgi:hypothetical protein